MSNVFNNKKGKKFNLKVWKYSWITVGIGAVTIPTAMLLDARFNQNSHFAYKTNTRTQNNQTDNQNTTPALPNPPKPQNPQVQQPKPGTKDNEAIPVPQKPKPKPPENAPQPRTLGPKELVKKQHDLWVQNGYNLTVFSDLVDSSVFGALVALRNLNSNNPAEVISKINAFLPDAKEKKFANFNSELVALGFKLKVTNVIPDYNRQVLRFNLSILDAKNQVVNFFDNGPSSLTYQLRGFKKGFAIAPLDTYLQSIFTKHIGYRVDVIIPDVKTKEQARWWLQEVARQASIGVDVNDLHSFDYDNNPAVAQLYDAVIAKLIRKNNKNQDFIPYILRMIDFNPEDRSIEDESKQPSYRDDGSTLIAGGRKYNPHETYNGMNGFNNTINGLEGLKKELINLLKQINKNKPNTDPYQS